MARLKVAEQAILVAVETAVVDADAPEAERFFFDRAALERVTEMFKRPGGEDLVIKAWHNTQRELFDRVPASQANDSEEVQAVLRLLQTHLALKERLKSIRDVQYRVTDDGVQRLPMDEVPLENDPWIAERNW